jgi:GAF domain-containing protein
MILCVRIDDIRADPVSGSWARAAREVGFTAALSVPIATNTEIAAALSLYADRTTGRAAESLIAAETVADHAGSAIAIAHRLTTRTSYYRRGS